MAEPDGYGQEQKVVWGQMDRLVATKRRGGSVATCMLVFHLSFPERDEDQYHSVMHAVQSLGSSWLASSFSAVAKEQGVWGAVWLSWGGGTQPRVAPRLSAAAAALQAARSPLSLSLLCYWKAILLAEPCWPEGWAACGRPRRGCGGLAAAAQ